MKKILITFVALFILVVVIGGYAFLKSRRQAEQNTQVTKAEEIQITTIEGWDNAETAEYLEKLELVRAEDFIAAQKKFDVSEYPILKSIPEGFGLEGFLFPDTYRLLKPKAAFEAGQEKIIIGKMLDNFSLKFTQEMQGQADKLKMSVYEIITLASIVESETGRNVVGTTERQALAREREIVAGIFYNRLKVGMALQSDATVNYITKKNTPSASLADTEINSPYNTYKYPGLPPGPISNPSLSSIMATLYPKASDYFYFLHKQPSGEAVYSKTFEEHVQNKQRYLR